MRTALIVDDNEDIRMLLKHALEIEGYQVLEAENGLIAQQQLLAGTRPCVVLLDIMMPVMDGKAFLEWKNKHVGVEGIPVIVLSALQNGTDLTGAKAYLRKPVDLDSLFNLVGDCCAS